MPNNTPPQPPLQIRPLPTPPTMLDTASFPVRGDEFIGALPDFQQDANALAANVAQNAEAAVAAAAAAVAVANAPKWLAGAAYAQGAAVYSPIDFQTYRRRSAGSSASDPSQDPANWALVGSSGLSLAQVQAIALCF